MEREQKGESIVCFPEDYVIIDLETTGLDPSYDEIIEAGAIRVRNGEKVDTFNSLIKPSRPIYTFIEELTGITNEMLATAPSREEVLPMFKDFVGNDIIVGHNVNFDINFLYDNFVAMWGIPFGNNFVDTLRLSRKALPELPHHRLSHISKALGIGTLKAHRSIADCETVYSCLNKMKEQISNTVGIDAFVASFRRTPKKKLDLRTITPDNYITDESHPLYGKVCVFTGALKRMTRSEAAQIVVNIGGICDNNITKKTNFLILGNNDYCPTIKDGKSSKQKKAEEYKLKGFDIEILSENVFYDLISE